MDAKVWQHARKIFDTTAGLPDNERQDIINEACADSPELRKEVEALLRSHDTLGNFLEPPAEPDHQSTSEQHDSLIGKQVGPYRIERGIGVGGMGMVFQAVRDYGQYQKKVAVKFVRNNAWENEIRKRFEQEQETLARLEHPNIARIIDNGTIDDGTVYLVMDYVDGVPVDEYCDTNRLSLTQRLKLFRTICAAVQYAHQNLIVHRDIKPGNILVTADGTPKLLDFGVAKLLDDTQTTETREHSGQGFRFLTIEYASPELIKGEVITTSSDVYSLGVLLYKLVAGRSPYQFASRLPHEMTRVVCEQEPLKPSTSPHRVGEEPSSKNPSDEIRAPGKLNPNNFRRELRGDLDSILLKALEKDPQRRYASVEHFSEDIRKHLEGFPVSARRETGRYRVRKFVQRHTVGVSTTAIIVLALFGGVAGILWQSNKARKEAAKAEQVSRFLEEMLASADPTQQGKDVTVAQTLGHAIERVDQELVDQPEVAATLLNTIGEAYIGLGLYDKARPQLEKSLALRLKTEPSGSAGAALSYHSLAFLAHMKSEYARAESLYQIALDMYRREASDPDRQYVSMMSDWGTLLYEKGDLTKALRVLKESVALARTVSGTMSREYAVTLGNLGPALTANHDLAAAESAYAEAISVQRRFLGDKHTGVAAGLNNLAFVLIEKGDISKAETLFRQSLNIRREVLGTSHPEVASSLVNLANVLLNQGKAVEAETLASDAASIMRRSSTVDNARLSSALHLLAKAKRIEGSANKAEPYAREALKIREKLFPPHHPAIAGAMVELASSLIVLRKFSEAEDLLLAATADLEKTYGSDHPVSQNAAKQLGTLHETRGTKPHSR